MTDSSSSDSTCIFCKIIKGEIPSFKLSEDQNTFAFLDINPISLGHALVIPKHHGAKLHDLPDGALQDILPTAKKIAKAMDLIDYNVLQNNGRIAHQVVDHVHFHIIPKPAASDEVGLVIGWPSKSPDMTQLGEYAKMIKEKIDTIN
ncbi:HIT-like domain-containing protein [Melampsora americana]|nr:HIT-like domain-containing protein [Melampsora americana]